MQEMQSPSGEIVREVFNRATPKELKAAMDARRDQLEAEGFKFVGRKKIGRNDPCPCGSGIKFKRCCIETIAKASRDQFARVG